jgi:hypothetical protein
MGVPRDQWPVRESGLAVWVVRIGSWGIAETPRVDEAALVIDGAKAMAPRRWRQGDGAKAMAPRRWRQGDGAKAMRRAVTDVFDHPVGSAYQLHTR